MVTYSAVARVSRSASTGPPGSTLGSNADHGHPPLNSAPLGIDRLGPTPARRCTPGSGPGGPIPPAAPQGSSTSSPPGSTALARPDPLLDHRAADHADPGRHSGDRRGGLGRDRLSRRRSGAGRRDPLSG